jgi:hypothetical protein
VPPPTFPAESSSLLKLILQQSQGFYVPLYQRPFTWGAEQVDRLFEDLLAGIDRTVLGESPATFLGSVILFEGRNSVNPKNANALPGQVLHVVDGQQRLTTVLLLLATLSRHAAQHLTDLQWELAGKAPDVVGSWLIGNLQQLREYLFVSVAIDLIVGENEYKWKPRLIRQEMDRWGNTAADARYDSDISWFLMESIRKRHNNDELPPITVPSNRPHLDLAVGAIEDALSKALAGEPDDSALSELAFLANLEATNRLVGPSELETPIIDFLNLSDIRKKGIRLTAIANFLLNGVLVIDVRAPNEDYAFILFEPLNTTGQPLTPIDTLRPLVVQGEGNSYVGSPSEVSFKVIDRYLPTEMESGDRAKRTSELLTSFFLVEAGTKLSHNILDQRRALRSGYTAATSAGGITSARAFLAGLSDTAVFLRDIWEDAASPLITNGSDFDQLCLEVLRASRHTIALPLLIRYHERAESVASPQSKLDFLSVLRSITAFWTLWRTARATTSGVDDLHRSLLRNGLTGTGLPALTRQATAADALPAPADINAALRDRLSARLRVADRAAWTAMVGAQPIYQTAKVLGRFLLFAAHEDAASDPAAPGQCMRGVAGSFAPLRVGTWKQHYTVEHIAPQNMVAADTTYDDTIYRDGLVDRLGNLTLLPGDINGYVANRPWPQKRDTFSLLGELNPVARLHKVEAAVSAKISARTKNLLQSADFMPYAKFVSECTGPSYSADFVRARGERLADLAWDRLWRELQ